MKTDHRRVIRLSPTDLHNDPELRDQYLKWVAHPSTKMFLQVTHDMHVGGVVSATNPLAAQDALCRQKFQEGAVSAINTLLNLDDPEIASSEDAGEPVATWGTDINKDNQE